METNKETDLGHSIKELSQRERERVVVYTKEFVAQYPTQARKNPLYSTVMEVIQGMRYT